MATVKKATVKSVNKVIAPQVKTLKKTVKPVAKKTIVKADTLQAKVRHQVQAGFEAVNQVQDKGQALIGKVLDEGKKLQKSYLKAADVATKDVRNAVEGRLKLVKNTAEQQVNKIERVFETRVNQVLGRLGVPSKHDVQTLSKRVAELSKEVKALAAKRAA
jgi:poly(hydroxyalkanoate) granule-associated protein